MVYWKKVIASVTLVSTVTSANSNNHLSKRVNTIHAACPMTNKTLTDEVFTSFTGLIANDFIVGSNNEHGIEGTLLVGGMFNTRNYYVNKHQNVDCTQGSDQASLSNYGLVVIQSTIAENVFVNGEVALIGGNGNKGGMQTSGVCSITNELEYGGRQLQAAQDSAISASYAYAKAVPHYFMDGSGKITKRIDEGDDQFAIFTFDRNCVSNPNAPCIPGEGLSDPTAFLFNNNPNAPFSGPSGDVPPSGTTVVFNIPVLQDTSLAITNEFISSGLEGCYTIFNFFPVDPEGYYSHDALFSLTRENHGTLPGFILAPKAEIIDTSGGSFVGQIIADSYRWRSNEDGTDIKGYDKCAQFEGCFVIKEHDMQPTATVTIQEAVKTVSISETPTVYVVAYEYEDKRGWGSNEKKGSYHDWDNQKKYDYSKERVDDW